MKAYMSNDVSDGVHVYTIGKTYECEKVIPGEYGYYAWLDPLECLGCDLGNSIFYVVDIEGVLDEQEGKSCVWGSRITILSKISIKKLLELALAGITMVDKCNATSVDDTYSITCGHTACSSTSGDFALSITIGTEGNSATSGDNANSITCGDGAASATSGEWADSITYGSGSRSATSGYGSSSITFGFGASSATSGWCADSRTKGDCAHSVTCGDNSHSITQGRCANAVTCGDDSDSCAMGKNSIAASLGLNGRVKGAIGNVLVLIQYDDEGYPKKAVSRVVDGTSILPNRWYKLDEFGEFHLTKRKLAL